MLLVGCKTPAPSPQIHEPTPTIGPPAAIVNVTATSTSPLSQSTIILPVATTKFTEQIAQMKTTWESYEITSYHITIRFYENFMNRVETRRTVDAENGQALSSSCVADSCPFFVFEDVYTIDDLFLVAQGATRSLMFEGIIEEYDDCVRELQFDETYGFPMSMEVDCSNAYDEDHSFEVITFEALK